MAYFHKEIDDFLDFAAGIPQFDVLFINFVDHAQIKILIVIEFLVRVLMDDTLHESPDIFLHILC